VFRPTRPLPSAMGLEGARDPCAPVWIRPWYTLYSSLILLLLIAAPTLGLYYFLSLTVSVRLSQNFKLLLIFLFLDGIKPFWLSVLRDPSIKRCSSIFDLGPLTPKIYSPKICTKSPISRLVWQINRRCLAYQGFIRGWPIQWNHAKCCGADPCCHGN